MNVFESPIDDTVQLDEMAAEADDDNMLNFPQTHDDVRIIQGNEDSEDEHHQKKAKAAEKPRISRKAVLTIIVLACINLLNYMDRFTVAGECSKFETLNYVPMTQFDQNLEEISLY